MLSRKIYAPALLGLFSLFISCQTETDQYVDLTPEQELRVAIVEDFGSLNALQEPLENDLAHIPQDPKNPLTEKKVDLGRLLFHETALGVDPHLEKGRQTYSCATCHHAAADFQSGMRQAIGEGGSGYGQYGEGRVMDADYDATTVDIQTFRTPTVVNSAYQKVMLWSGKLGATGDNMGTEALWDNDEAVTINHLGYEGVETQAIVAIKTHRMRIDKELLTSMGYKSMFDEVFADVPEADRYTRVTAGLAMAAYERSILANEAPFQQWLRNEIPSLGDKETLGAKLFFGKAECYTCHYGPGLSGDGFYGLGMNDLEGTGVIGMLDDVSKRGRGGFTQRPEDNYHFKTPPLYNLKEVHFFGHGGSFTKVKDVIHYLNVAEAENEGVPQDHLSEQFHPLNLTSEEEDELTAFVENSLYDPNLMRYQPESTPTGRCLPNSDPQSQQDMGCGQ